MGEKVIVKCIIKRHEVFVLFSNKQKVKLFSFDSDKFAISENDLTGLTEMEAFMVRSRKENIYLTK